MSSSLSSSSSIVVLKTHFLKYYIVGFLRLSILFTFLFNNKILIVNNNIETTAYLMYLALK